MECQASQNPQRELNATFEGIQGSHADNLREDMPGVHQGGCLCGYVRYRTFGNPERTTICHCTFCQRLTGSAFLVEPIFLIANVEVESGAVGTCDHRSPDHGRTLRIHFCPKYGTHLSLLFERFPFVQAYAAVRSTIPTGSSPTDTFSRRRQLPGWSFRQMLIASSSAP